jgi:hypothetical protein
MNRFVLGLVLFTAACGGNKNPAGGGESLCADQVPPPAACNTPCDPVSGAADCPDGFHCSPDGKCDTQCTATGNECGSGNTCTFDGLCQQGDDPGPPPVDADCPAVHFAPTRVTPSIEIVFDRSDSMKKAFSATVTDQKFATEQKALVDTSTGIVTQLQGAAYFGISMYPGPQCTSTFSVPRALNNATKIAELIAAHGPGGNTPTAEAIKTAVADFAANKPPTGSPPIIVLSTDGQPNDCNSNKTEAPSIQAAKDAFAAGIKLYVLGVGDGFPPDFAQELANAGQGVQAGQPNAKAYSSANPAEMATAFQQIIGGAVSCDLTIDGKVDPAQAQSGSVTLNGTNLIFNTDWTLDANGTTIHIIGNSCTTLKSSANAKVDATFPCGAVLL